MNSYTDEELLTNVEEQDTGYSTNLTVYAATAGPSATVTDVPSHRSGLELAFDHLQRLKRNGKFDFKTAPFWSNEPIEIE